jgi:quinol monooxygenase YgiN
MLKPHCIQSSQVLVTAGTSKYMLRRHGIQAVTRVMAYVTKAVTLWRCLQQCVLAALNQLRAHWRHQPWNGCIEYSVASDDHYRSYHHNSLIVWNAWHLEQNIYRDSPWQSHQTSHTHRLFLSASRCPDNHCRDLRRPSEGSVGCCNWRTHSLKI